MKTVEHSEATASLANYARRAGKSAVVVTDNGKLMAALVAIGDADWESIGLSTNSNFLRIIERSRQRYRREGALSDRQVRERLGVKPKRRRRGTNS